MATSHLLCVIKWSTPFFLPHFHWYSLLIRNFFQFTNESVNESICLFAFYHWHISFMSHQEKNVFCCSFQKVLSRKFLSWSGLNRFFNFVWQVISKWKPLVWFFIKNYVVDNLKLSFNYHRYFTGSKYTSNVNIFKKLSSYIYRLVIWNDRFKP